jgi:uncharacterized protein (TIGR03663 family)
VPWAILALALALRLAALDLRPPHSDEGVNGWFAERVLAEGYYAYDAENYHGPLHFYLLALSRLGLGRDLWSLRLPSVLAGVLAVWVLLRCRDALGTRAAWLAALLLAVSPALVLYARWAIHESELLLFSLLVFRGLCRSWVRPGDRLAPWLIGLSVAGALATKEVWVLHAAVLAPAALAWWWLERRQGLDVLARLPSWRSLLAPAAVGLLALLLLYSGFGRDPRGVLRFFAPYAIWTERAIQGAGHEKPWHYWLELLILHEPGAFAGLLVAPWALRLAPPLLRLLAFYALGILTAYSAVPYKTPWCIVQLVWPLALLAGWSLDELLRQGARRLLVAGVTALLTLASLAVAVRVNFDRYDDAAEPYVYVQPYRAGLAPVELLLRAAEADPSLYREPVHVVMKLSWPIPWLLADFAHAGHWSGEQLPPGDALALFVDEPHRAAVEARLRRRYRVIRFDVSPVHAPSRAYFDAERFAGWLPADAETFAPAATR